MILHYHLRRRKNWKRHLFLAITLLLTVALPAYLAGPSLYTTTKTHYRAWLLTREGRRRADTDWARHEAFIYDRVDPSWSFFSGFDGNPWANCEVDEASGLHIPRDSAFEEWHPAYAARLAELLRTHGKPSWMEYPAFPPTRALTDIAFAMERQDQLSATMQIQEIGTLPFKLTPTITLAKKPLIATPYSKIDCDPIEVVRVARHGDYPHVLFILPTSAPYHTLFVFTDDGRPLARAGWGLVPVAAVATGIRR